MNRPVKKILIVVKPEDRNAQVIRVAMMQFLVGRGVEVQTCEHRPNDCTEAEEVAADFDLVIVLGGDGTFIGVARRLLPLGLPLMGVNLGRVGFLAQLNRDHWRHWLDAILKEGFKVARRLVLTYALERDGKSVHTGVIINDLVVSRGELARLIRLGVSFDGMEISSLRADGLIVSTPTGSSAYGVSAGGPLMHAELQAYCVTPVCPFLNSFKPMVFPAEGVVRIRVEEKGGEVNLTEDGQSIVSVLFGDEVVLEKANIDLLVVDLGPRAYFEKLKKHGFLSER